MYECAICDVKFYETKNKMFDRLISNICYFKSVDCESYRDDVFFDGYNCPYCGELVKKIDKFKENDTLGGLSNVTIQ